MGEPRDTGIHPDDMPFLKRYVKARAAILAKAAPTCEALFPAIQDMKKGGDGNYSQDNLRKLRARVIAQTGIHFDSRACRRTFDQKNVDMGVPIESVSRILGHCSNKTTEKYYCRKTSGSAISDALKVWGGAHRNPGNSRSRERQYPSD